jgi:hypothetical protein
MAGGVVETVGHQTSAAIGEAVDPPLERLRAGCGIWTDRDDIDFRKIREDFDRS